MTELYRSDADLTALLGTVAACGAKYPAASDNPWLVSRTKADSRIVDALAPLTELEVFKDGTLTFGVRAGEFLDGATVRTYAGAAAQALSASLTNYIYLTAGGTLTVNTTGFPAAGTTPHIPLAQITTTTVYAVTDIIDRRPRAIFRCASALTPANANVLQASLFTGNTASAADSLAIPVTHRHVSKTTGADAEALTLADGVQGQLLTVTLTVDGGGDGTLTPSRKTGFVAVVLADAGDAATLEFVDGTVGWVIVGLAGVAAPPVITI